MIERPNEYDLRQYELMRKTLSSFDKGETDLPDLIATLDALLAALEDAPEDWRKAFQAEWWTLEQVYAVALDRGQDAMAGENGSMVQGAVARLKDLVAERAVRSG